ncbi:MAG: hypothetical protein WAN44_11965, partial [Propionibacteriaceae bacterium]
MSSTIWLEKQLLVLLLLLLDCLPLVVGQHSALHHDHVFVILHAPERGKHGHVHYIELDQFVGLRYLVTVHGPINPAVHP